MLHFYNPETVRKSRPPFRRIYSHAVELSSPNRIIHVSGQIGITPDGKKLLTFEEQCAQAMRNVELILEDVGMSLANVMKATYYVTDPEFLPILTKLRQERWASDNPPAVTTLVVSALADPDLLVEIEVVAGQ